jgi:hypothetical protein
MRTHKWKVTETEFCEIQDGGSRQVLQIEISTVSTDHITSKLHWLVAKLPHDVSSEWLLVRLPPIPADMLLVFGAPQVPQHSGLLFFVFYNAHSLNNKLPEVHCLRIVSSMWCVLLKRGSILQLLIVSCWIALITQFFVLIVLFRIMAASY